MKIRKTRTQLGVCAIAGSVWLVCGVAYGQRSAPDARELFKQARALVSEGKYSEACPIFEKSQALENGIGTQFNLADCWEHLGRTASAHRLFLSVAEAASAKGESERAKVATERAVVLASKLSHLQIRHDKVSGELRVFREKELVEQLDWNRPAPVDPGSYRVELVSDGEVTWQTKVDVPARSLTVLVTIPRPTGKSEPTELTSEPAAETQSGRSEPLKAPPSRIRTQALPPEPPPVAEKKSSIWPPVAIVAGIGGIGAGTIFGLMYLSKNGNAKDVCPGNTDCSESDIARHESLVDSAKTARLGAYLGFGLGTASIAAATIYYATRRSTTDYRPPVSLRISPTIQPGQRAFLGVAAHGSF